MSTDRGPGVRIPPPMLVGGVMLLGWGMTRLLPLPVAPRLPGLGALVFGTALALAGWAVLAMVRAGTNPRPDRPDQALLETGPFRWSRNPIYLGFVLVAAALALALGDLWPWIATAACALLLDRAVIAREEAYLAARFGAPYLAYKGRVRRWV